MLSSMCAGAKNYEAKRITKTWPLKKGNEKRCCKFTWRIRFYFEIEYSNAVLSRGTLIHRCWCGSCAQENLQKPWQSNLSLKTAFLWNSMLYPDCPVHSPECPDPCVRSIQTNTRSLRVTVTHPKFLWDRSLRTPVSGVSGHIPGVSRYPLPNGKFSVRGGINTPHTPSFISLLLIWTRTRLQEKGELSHCPSVILEWFSLGIRVRLLQEQRLVLVSFHSISWAQHPCLAGGFKSITLGASSS
jgi:hypothetical protein